VNLLQPQDRRSADAGDSGDAIEARRRLLEAGIGLAILQTFVRRAASLHLEARDVVVDLGCGAGDALAALSAATRIDGIGIDLAVRAVALAARRFPGPTWVVANADRRLPLREASVALACSLHGRRNPTECARVLRKGGWLMIATPAPDDLIELRTVVQGAPVERSRAERVLSEHQALFDLADRVSRREHHRLERAHLIDLLRGTYRGARASVDERVQALSTLDVTLASDLFLFTRR
jgi:23S rRNA (guanine745-N1)-methyltransferase